jgi:hypothetical protein
VQGFPAVVRHQHQFTRLHAGPLVLGDDVGLDDDGHPGGEGELRGPLGLQVRSGQHGRQVAAAVAVHQVVVDREPGGSDDASGFDQVTAGGTGAQPGRDGIEGRVSYVVQVPV